MTRLVIAVDGPAASGKGTIAHGLAQQYGLPCLDTGLLYRAVGVLAQVKTGGVGEAVSFDEILADIRKRDERDSRRSAAPLIQAEDAVLLDTSKMTIPQAADAARRIVEAARTR